MTKIAAGKFYRIREGRVIGPAKRNATGVNELSHPWQVGGLTYADDGTYYAPFGTDLDIVEEADRPPLAAGFQIDDKGRGYTWHSKEARFIVDEPEKL